MIRLHIINNHKNMHIYLLDGCKQNLIIERKNRFAIKI